MVRKIFKRHRGPLLAGGLLVAFTGAAVYTTTRQVRSALAVDTTPSITRAWRSLERHFRDPSLCARSLRGTSPGERPSLDVSSGPWLGQEWERSGWLVQDVYLLSKEDELAWQLDPLPEGAYLKISLVPAPPPGQRTGLDYLLQTRPTSKLIPLRVQWAQEEVFRGCHRHRPRNDCARAARIQGVEPQMRWVRLPAGVLESCPGRRGVEAHCLLPGDGRPLWDCR